MRRNKLSGNFSDDGSTSQPYESDSEGSLTLPNSSMHADLLSYLQILEDFSIETPTPPVFLAALDISAGFDHIQTTSPLALFALGNSLDVYVAISALDNLATYHHCVSWADFFRDVRTYLRQG